jgi:perosamine synthetase
VTAARTTIPITKPLIGEEELRAVQRPLEAGWVVQGPYVEEFERKFSEFTGARFSVATSSCTTALHIAVAALGLERGDEVIVPAFTWVSTANVVEYMGARPVFCDIDLETFNVDPRQIEQLITARTVGIIPVHLFGLCADMEAIGRIAEKHRLWVVEDGACALGATLGGRHAGTFAEMGCFSFHPRKSITTGEGGMITTDREDFDRLTRSLRDHGASRSDFDRHTTRGAFRLSEYHVLGFNFRMTDLQGALGSAQMDRAQGVVLERRQRAAIYDQALADAQWLRTPGVPEGYEHGYQAYVCLYQPEEPTLSNADRLRETHDELMAALEERGIATRQGTHAAALQSFYTQKYGISPSDFPNALLADALTIALPLFPQLTDAEQNLVCEALLELHA